MRVIDGDSHFLEPLDLWERYIDPQYRERAVHFRKDPTNGEYVMIADGKPMPDYAFSELLGDIAAYGQKEEGRKWGEFEQELALSLDWQDMNKRIAFLDEEGIDAQVVYPSLALLWEFMLTDPALADAHCRAYNTWAFELASSHKNRLYPGAHLSLRDPQLAVRELQRIARLGGRTAFVAAIPINGKSFGHPDFDPVWATAQDLDISVSIHISFHLQYPGSAWYQDRVPGMMYLSMSVPQEPRLALATMVFDGVFERFPKLRVATVEAKSGWVGEWLERLDYHYGYQGHHSQMKRPASEYFARNIGIGADPEEKMLPHVVQFAGDDKFFIGSDYPHGEGFTHPMQKARQLLSATLPAASVAKILGANAARFYGM